MIRLPYGTTESREPIIHVHRFETRDTKTEQRFYAGAGERRLRVSLDSLAPDERAEIINQFAAAQGSYLPFTINLVLPDGSTEVLTVRFSNSRLEIQTLIDGSTWAASFDLIVDPGAAPAYTSASTETRFPGASLQAALLSPVQEIIPLLVITTLAGTVHRVSERACAVDGVAYSAKLIEWDGIKQSLYGADQASFTLANADRAFTTAVNADNWHAADVQFSLLHVGTLIKLNLWRGHVIPGGWDLSSGTTFRITAGDGAYQLRLAYPPRKITRQDGFVTPADHQPVNLGKGKNRITATSVINDTGYGKPLKDIWVNDATAPLHVRCDVLAGRDEKEFYAAIGIVGRGPIGDFGAVPIIAGATIYKYGTLDGQPHHGPGLLGLRRSRGGNAATGSETQINSNPDAGSTILAIDEVGTPLPATPLAPPGAAFLQIRRTDEAGIQPDNATKEHELIAFVSQGNGGYIWTAGVRSWSPALTNPAWIEVNVWLRGLGLGAASQAAQEAEFDVVAAEAFAATCATVAPVLVGSGTESQFRFVGVIEEEKPLRDWLKEILACALGYFTFSFGKLKLGSRFHSGSTEAFDSGNIILNSLSLSAATAEYNNLSATFADREYGYQSNTLEFRQTDHITAIGEETKASINLVGVATKSQAARLATTLVREQLGGVNAAEWAKARRIGLSTTVLALNVDCGTIGNLTHADMPSGAGEFIVEGWTLNRDMSISIEGRSTTDAMYDMLVGNKPTDVAVNLPPGSVDKLPGLFIYTPVVKDIGFLTLTNCSMTDGSNRGLRSVTVFLIYIDETEPNNWVTNNSDPGTVDPATFNVTPNGVVTFGVDDYVVFEDVGDYEIDRITAIATPAWTLQRSWPGNDPAEAIFESLRAAHAAGTRIYRCKVQKFSFNAAGGTFEDSSDTGTLATEFACQIADARVMAVVASASNGYGYSDWVVYNLGAGLSTGNMSTYGGGSIPPDPVTIVSADYEYIDAYRLRVRIYWTPPVVPGTFAGVHCFEESPDVSSIGSTPMDGTQAMDGTSNLGGDWAPADLGRGVVSPFVIEMAAPVIGLTKRFYLASYSAGAEAPLVRATDPSPTPSITLAIVLPVYQSGVEYAQLVTGAVATIEYDESQVASPKYRIRFQWAVPSIASAAWQLGFGGVQIVYQYDDGGRANGPSFAVNELDAKSDWYDLYVGTSVIGCWFVSYDNSEQPRLNTIVPGVTPRSDVTVVWPLATRSAASPYADNVTAFAVSNARYTTNGQGLKVLKIDWVWTIPVGADALARWGGAIIYLFIPGDTNPYQISGAESGAAGTMEFSQFPIAIESWTFYAISQDNNGNPNTTAAAPIGGTPSSSISVGPPTPGAAGTEWTGNVTSPSFSVASVSASDGTTTQRISATFTRPGDVTWGGVEGRVYDGAALVAKTPASASPWRIEVPNPTTSTTLTVKLVSFDVNGQTNTETAGTPQGTVLVGSTAGTLDLRKFLPASTDNFAIVGSFLQIKTGVAITVDASGNLRVAVSGIDASLIAAGAVGNAALINGSVDDLKLAAAAVTAAKIAAGAVTSPAIAASAVTAGKIAALSIVAGDIAADAITAAKILAGSITTVKIAAGAVTATEIAALAIVAGKIAANAITATEIATDAVTAGKILAGSITTGKVAANAISSDKLDATVINVGGGGSKPGKFAVFNAAGSQIGFIGVEGGNEGGWFRTLSIGGTSYSTGKLKADASGNVTIDGATLTLFANGITSVIDNSNSGGYVSGFRSTDASGYLARMGVSSGGGGIPFVSTLRGSIRGEMTSDSSGAYLTLTNSVGTQTIELDGNQGRANLTSVNASSSYSVASSQVVAARKTGWATATGTATRTTFATSTVTLPELAERLKALIDDLHNSAGHGLIGT